MASTGVDRHDYGDANGIGIGNGHDRVLRPRPRKPQHVQLRQLNRMASDESDGGSGQQNQHLAPEGVTPENGQGSGSGATRYAFPFPSSPSSPPHSLSLSSLMAVQRARKLNIVARKRLTSIAAAQHPSPITHLRQQNPSPPRANSSAPNNNTAAASSQPLNSPPACPTLTPNQNTATSTASSTSFG